MTNARTLLATLGVLISIGCATVNITAENRDLCGPRPTEQQARNAVSAWTNLKLKDPFSAMVRNITVGEQAGWKVSGILVGNETKYGWTILFDVNARNSYGGYVGWSTHELLFTPDERIWADTRMGSP